MNSLWRGPCITAYPTVDNLQNKIREYFDMCWEVTEDNRGYEKIIEHRPATFSGLARYLGFSSRRELLNYSNNKNPEYEMVIKNAMLAIEDYMEGKLITSKGNVNGLIFALKNNARWEDTQQTRVINDGDKDEDNSSLMITWSDKNHAGDVVDAETLSKTQEKQKDPLLVGEGTKK